ncbi:hypothetical protein [Marivirga arenosa]|uniref:DUF4168 domain-containing protein n=1 Tax=Marivirga arenosa TaxID=3059076 RepID=A0AA49GKG9_9BACT|nr:MULTISPECIES: hypothetical protein [unclassified Marivirga]WKK80548.1 hypothetical protein QYS47_26035 [Marivirga sp. BKB1-2]WKK84470.1 hypothetical protein QYS48_20235 [Marivirga sp. ABR2-2]
MKRIVRQGMLALAALVFLNSTAVMAQDSEISDKDLYNFALMMQVIEQMKAEVSPAIQSLIEQQEGFDTKRYSELESAGDDEAKLRELGANDFEVQFMGLIIKEKEKRTDAIKEALNILAKSMVGVKTYKTIKSTLSVDPDLKAKYQEIVSRMAPTYEDA